MVSVFGAGLLFVDVGKAVKVGTAGTEVEVAVGNTNVGMGVEVEIVGRLVAVKVGMVNVGKAVEVALGGMEVMVAVGGAAVAEVCALVWVGSWTAVWVGTTVADGKPVAVAVYVGLAVTAVNVGTSVGVDTAGAGASGQPTILAGKLAGSPPGGRTYFGRGKLRKAPKSAPIGTIPDETK